MREGVSSCSTTETDRDRLPGLLFPVRIDTFCQDFYSRAIQSQPGKTSVHVCSSLFQLRCFQRLLRWVLSHRNDTRPHIGRGYKQAHLGLYNTLKSADKPAFFFLLSATFFLVAVVFSKVKGWRWVTNSHFLPEGERSVFHYQSKSVQVKRQPATFQCLGSWRCNMQTLNATPTERLPVLTAEAAGDTWQHQEGQMGTEFFPEVTNEKTFLMSFNKGWNCWASLGTRVWPQSRPVWWKVQRCPLTDTV